MIKLRSRRETLGVSQSKLARISGVSRFKICMFELGGGTLSPEECQRIKFALETEAARIRSIASIDLHDVEFSEGK
jgi:predicted transcriptional regulator